MYMTDWCYYNFPAMRIYWIVDGGATLLHPIPPAAHQPYGRTPLPLKDNKEKICN